MRFSNSSLTATSKFQPSSIELGVASKSDEPMPKSNRVESSRVQHSVCVQFMAPIQRPTFKFTVTSPWCLLFGTLNLLWHGRCAQRLTLVNYQHPRITTVIRCRAITIFVRDSSLLIMLIIVGLSLSSSVASIAEGLKNRIAFGAAYNSSERQSASSCLPGTREHVVANILNWMDGGDGRTVCWLYGPAGSGKSTIAHAIAERCEQESESTPRIEYPKGRLAASFFFSRGTEDRSVITYFFPTIAYQLAISLPSIRKDMREALRGDPLIVSQSLMDQFKKLIVDPIRPFTESESIPTMIVVVDGLDECEEKDAVALIRVLLSANAASPLLIRFFFTSRADDAIQQALKPHSSVIYPLDLSMTEFDAHHDIHTFLKDGFSDLYEEKSDYMGDVEPPWPTPSDLELLVEKSEGLFIYASTLLKFVGDTNDGRLPDEKLQEAMKGHNGLDDLYRQVLGDAPQHSTDLFRRILGALVVLRDRLPTNSLACLLRIDPARRILPVLRGCRSILMIPDDLDMAINFFHASLQDFLMSGTLSGDNYFIDPVQHHLFILDDCIQIMMKEFSLLSDGAAGDNIQQQSSQVLLYACRSWYHHMINVVEKDEGIWRINSDFETRLTDFFIKMKHNWAKLWMDSLNFTSWYAGKEVDDLFALASMIKVGLVNFLSSHVTGADVPTKKYSNGSGKLFKMLCGVLKCIQVCP
jgi:hypothetical protein